MKCQRVYIFLFKTVLYFSEFHLPFWDFGIRYLSWWTPHLYSCMLNCFSCVWLFVTPWTIARQAPPSMEFSRQEYWSGLPCPPPGDLSKPRDQAQASHIAGRFFIIWATWEAHTYITNGKISAKIKFGKERGWIDLRDFPGSRIAWKSSGNSHSFCEGMWKVADDICLRSRARVLIVGKKVRCYC